MRLLVSIPISIYIDIESDVKFNINIFPNHYSISISIYIEIEIELLFELNINIALNQDVISISIYINIEPCLNINICYGQILGLKCDKSFTTLSALK